MPDSDDFKRELSKAFRQAENLGFHAIEISAGSLHRRVGGYPGPDHRIPVCCNVMRNAIQAGDIELPNDLKKDGASFAVLYRIPR